MIVDMSFMDSIEAVLKTPVSSNNPDITWGLVLIIFIILILIAKLGGRNK